MTMARHLYAKDTLTDDDVEALLSLRRYIDVDERAEFEEMLKGLVK